MSMPVSYQTPTPPGQSQADLSHLKTLAICHYVWGGLTMLISCIFIVHIVMGVVFLKNPGAFNSSPGMTGRSAPPPPPAFLGWFLLGFGSGLLLLGWTIGILTILSGRGLAKGRGRMFSLIVAGLSCLSVPIGTVLGVFTFVVLFRPSVIALYDPRKAAGDALPDAWHPPAAG